MKKRVDYYVEPRSLTWAACGFMALSFLLRVVWCARWPEELAGGRLYVHALLPLASCALFIVFLLALGRTRLWLSFIPACMGVLFFLLKAGSFVWWHQLLCTLLYLLVAALYGLTVFGVLPIRKLLIPLFALPLAFHIFVEDLIINRTVYAWSQWFQEWSVLCIMAGLLCLALALRERQPAPLDT